MIGTTAQQATMNRRNSLPTGSVTIIGTATEGQTLTASNTLADADGIGAVSYQWTADSVAIIGATGSSYTLTQAEVGKTITVIASYTDGFGHAENMTSAAVGPVVSAGPPAAGAYWAEQGGWYAATVNYADGRSFHLIVADYQQQIVSKINIYQYVGGVTTGQWDGMANTDALAAVSGAVAPAVISNLVHAGHSDWYIPARLEQVAIASVLAAGSTAIAEFKAPDGAQRYRTTGGVDASFWLTSTLGSYPDNAYGHAMHQSGAQEAIYLSSYYYVRPIRRVPV